MQVRALQILADNKDKLDALAAKLLEKEVIFREDLEEVFGQRAGDPELTETSRLNTNKGETPEEEAVTALDSCSQL